MMRSSVVLPQPDGPSSATSSPVGNSRLTSSSATKSPNVLRMLRTSMLMVPLVGCSWVPARHSINVLTTRVTSASSASSDATAKAAANWYSL